MAVWLGGFFLIAVLLGLRLPLPAFKWSDSASLGTIANSAVLGQLAVICVIYLLTSLPGAVALGANARRYVTGFPFVFLLAWLAQVAAGNATANYWGIEYVIFALILGLFVSNVIGVPVWLQEAVRTEYYIKTGLVIMGATILFQEIMTAGALGMLQALAVVIVIWCLTFWLAKRLRLDDEFGAILASAVSICGVSAAIATCGAIQGDRRKLSYVASLVLIVAVPMIVIQPWIIRGMNMPDVVGGAWLGGTLDTTGSVVAAGALISETAMKIGTIVKFSQNVLIGFAAFFLSIWWTIRRPVEGQERPTVRVIWERFPKFVLGFMVSFARVFAPGRCEYCQSHEILDRRPAHVVVRSRVYVHRAGNEVYRPALDGGRKAVRRISGRPVRQSDMDSAPGLPDLRRCLLRPSVDLAASSNVIPRKSEFG